jgi:hypothetical protein
LKKRFEIITEKGREFSQRQGKKKKKTHMNFSDGTGISEKSSEVEGQ